MVLIASCYTVLDALGPGVQSRHLVLPDQPLPPPPPPPTLCGESDSNRPSFHRLELGLAFRLVNDILLFDSNQILGKEY